MPRQIRTKILTVILATSLGALVLLSIVGMVSILDMRRLTLLHNDRLGNTAAGESQAALEARVPLNRRLAVLP